MPDLDRDRDVAAYYDQEAPWRATRAIGAGRTRRRGQFTRLLATERRASLIEIGTGPGRDAIEFVAAALAVTGLDLSAEHVRLARAAGIGAVLGSVLDLPFADGSFDAAWTMSTLLHVPNQDFDQAMSEVVRVARAAAPIAIGLWGGPDSEGPSQRDRIRPPRFFCFRSDTRLRSLLRPHGEVERFETWSEPGTDGLHYQWVVLRTPS